MGTKISKNSSHDLFQIWNGFFIMSLKFNYYNSIFGEKMTYLKTGLKKLDVLLTIFMIIVLAASLSTTIASTQNTSEQGQQNETGNNNNSTANSTSNYGPVFPDNIKQINKPDVTPVNQREQVRANEAIMFQYRNMTMLMNCTQNCEVEFNSDGEVSPKIFGLTIEPNQTMTLTMNLSKSPLQGALVNQRSLNFYLCIEPKEPILFQAQIRLHINQTDLSQTLNREVNASRLTWMYWNQTRAEWEPVESYMDQNGYLVCNTDHFSTWTVAEIEANQTPTPEPIEDNSFPIIYVVIGVVAAAVIVTFGIITYKKGNR